MSFYTAKFSPCADDLCWGNTHLYSWGKYLSCLIISAIRAKLLTVCGVTENFAHCPRCTRVHVAVVSTTGHSQMVAQSVNTCTPKAVRKILSNTADSENFGTNGRNYWTWYRFSSAVQMSISSAKIIHTRREFCWVKWHSCHIAKHFPLRVQRAFT